MRGDGLRFGATVPQNGYVWWYLDGVSHDGAHAITVIAFIGSVFSPYYAWSGRADPLNHVAMNVALYGASPRWAMTERGRTRARQTPDGFSVGPSSVTQGPDGLLVTVDERCAPIPRRLRGRIRVRPEAFCSDDFAIDTAGDHIWRPIAPAAPIEVEMDEPRVRWTGTGYLDMNFGTRALEETFSHWDWMRVDMGDGSSTVFYETEEVSGGGTRLALLSTQAGALVRIPSPARHRLPATLWRVPRSGWADEGIPTVRRTLEDTPFYVRSELETTIAGRPSTAIQESLSLRRFKNTLVKLMLPFRMPRLG